MVLRVLITILIIGSFQTVSVLSQVNKVLIDSLTTSLSLKKGGERLVDLIQLSDLLIDTNPSRSLFLSNEGEALATNQNKPELVFHFLLIKGKANAQMGNRVLSNNIITKVMAHYKSIDNIQKITECWEQLAENYMFLDKYEMSLEHYHQLLKIYEGLKDKSKIAKTKNNIGNVYYWKNDYHTALRFYEESILIHETHNLPLKGLATAYGNKAIILRIFGKSAEALEISFNVLEINQKNNEVLPIAKNYHHIGYTLMNHKLHDDALIYFNLALEIYQRLDSNDNLCILLTNLGEMAMAQGIYKEAEEYFKRSLALTNKLGRKPSSDLLEDFAKLYTLSGSFEQAISYANNGISLYNKEQNPIGVAWCQLSLGRSYLALGKLDLAENNLQSAYETIDSIAIPEDLLTVNELLTTLYKKTNNFKKLAYHQNKVVEYKDSLFSVQHIQEINKRLLQEKLKEKQSNIDSWKAIAITAESEINKLESTKHKLKQLQHLFIMSFVIIGAILAIWISRYRGRQQIIEEELKQSRENQSELEQIIVKRNQEVNDLSINLVRRNQALQDLKNSLFKLNSSKSNGKEVDDLIRRLHLDEMLQEDWNYFQSLFRQRFPEFFHTLKQDFPNLSQKDLRLCGLIRSDIAPQEIGDILGITIESVHSARYRLRKKFNLDRKEDLDAFIKKI